MVDATDALAREEVPVDNLVQEEPEVLQDLLEPVEDDESYAAMARPLGTVVLNAAKSRMKTAS